RKKRMSSKIRGTGERPRLNVFKSAHHIYAQVIDDSRGTTLAAASTLSPELRGQERVKGPLRFISLNNFRRPLLSCPSTAANGSSSSK
ncbi:MAG: hypothetical protein KJ607_02595, partial [Bacteroidetes bacterium]|nr:hypothetical protein [Bacteroidota bacterium]